MQVGIIKFTIHLPDNHSLKGKRRVINSLCQKLRNHFEISVAEVEHHDNLSLSSIGMSFVSNNGQVIQKVITDIMTYLQNYTGDFILGEFKQDVITGF